MSKDLAKLGNPTLKAPVRLSSIATGVAAVSNVPLAIMMVETPILGVAVGATCVGLGAMWGYVIYARRTLKKLATAYVEQDEKTTEQAPEHLSIMGQALDHIMKLCMKSPIKNFSF